MVQLRDSRHASGLGQDNVDSVAKRRLYRSATFLCLLLSAATLVIGNNVHADPTAASPPPLAAVQPKTAGRIVVPERTPIKLILDEDLKSGSVKVGDPVEYDLTEALYTPDHQLVAPIGTKAYGKVLKSMGHAMFGQGGKLEISAEYILGPDLTHIPLRGDPINRTGKNGMIKMMASAAMGGVLSVFGKGGDVILHKGQQVPVYVDQDTEVMPYMTLLHGDASPAATAASPTIPPTASRTVYTMKDGTTITGLQASFDGHSYAVVTDAGLRIFQASDVKSIEQVTPGGQVAEPAAPAPPPYAALAQPGVGRH